MFDELLERSGVQSAFALMEIRENMATSGVRFGFTNPIELEQHERSRVGTIRTFILRGSGVGNRSLVAGAGGGRVRRPESWPPEGSHPLIKAASLFHEAENAKSDPLTRFFDDPMKQ